MTTEHPKRFVAAGDYLHAAVKAQGHSMLWLAKITGKPYETLRGYRHGNSAPRRDDKFWTQLEKAVGPEIAGRYRAMVEHVRSLPSQRQRSDQRMINTLIDRGRVREAQQQLDLRGDPASEPAWAAVNLRLARALSDRGDTADAADAYLHAAAAVAKPEQRFPIIEELATRLVAVEAYEQAQEIMRAEVRTNPRIGRLWRRLGIVQWYAHLLADADASLNAAQLWGVPEARVGHARGQVLSEMGQHAFALLDLEKAMDQPLSDHSRGYALSAHAYSRYFLGDVKDAEREFAEAEALAPRNAWHYWRIGYCAHDAGDYAEAQRQFERSLREDTPKLNQHKREYAESAIKRYNEATQ